MKGPHPTGGGNQRVATIRNSEEPILIVDDNPDIRGTLADVLEAEGYRVQTAANGRQALECLHHSPPPCLILLDLTMPVMDGRTFLDHLAHEPAAAGVPVVIVSAIHDRSDLTGSPAVVECLGKPTDLEQLEQIVHRYCPLP
jgi:CheY-like chemotaxis protein